MDAGALANVVRRPPVASEAVAFERIALSVKLAIAVASVHGGRADLARELQALAGRYPTVRLVQAPGAAARLEAGPFRWPISATLRDALLAAARSPSAAAGTARAPAAVTAAPALSAQSVRLSAGEAATTGAADRHAVASPALPAHASARTIAAPSATPPLTAATAARSMPAPVAAAATNAIAPADVAALAAASQRAAAHFPAPSLAAALPPQIRTAAQAPPVRRLALPTASPLLDETLETTAAAGRLRDGVQASGLFTEAQLARLLKPAMSDATAEAAALRDLPRPPVDPMPGDRTAAQLEVLRRDAAAFLLSPWSGQEASLDLGREHVDEQGEGGKCGTATIFFATLRLDLPQLGAVAIRLRLLNSTLAAVVQAADPDPWRAALPELQRQLAARGLQAAALTALSETSDTSDAASA